MRSETPSVFQVDCCDIAQPLTRRSVEVARNNCEQDHLWIGKGASEVKEIAEFGVGPIGGIPLRSGRVSNSGF